jgi:hypothetical protein
LDNILNYEERTDNSQRKLCDEELQNMYSTNIIRMIKSRIRQAGYVAHTGQMRNAYRIVIENPEGKSPLTKPRHRWEDNIKMYLQDTF